jgi:G3E family GTPase
VLAAGEARAADLVGLNLFDPAAKSEEVRRWLAEDAFSRHDHDHDHHDHDHYDHHGNDPNRHGDVRAFALASGNAMPRRGLAQFLELLATAHGPALLRVKGIVRIAEDPERPMVIQAAQTLLHPPLTLDAWPDDDRRTRLVFITRGLDEAFVRRMFEAFAGELRPDTADPLADNPLAISGFSGRFG